MLMVANSTNDGFEADTETNVMGKLHYSEKFTEAGLTVVRIYFYSIFTEKQYPYKLPFQATTTRGKTHTEFWPRKVRIYGTYKFESGENYEAFMKEDGKNMGTLPPGDNLALASHPQVGHISLF